MFSVRQDYNPLNKAEKKKLTGVKKVAHSSDLLFSEIKRASRYNKMTINNLVTSCLSVTLKEYFESMGDKKTDRLNLIIPANIRFAPYKTLEEVRLENKFTAIVLDLPLRAKMEEAVKVVPKSLASLRDFSKIFATWGLMTLTQLFTPGFIL